MTDHLKRQALHIAQELPRGDETRRAILAAIKRDAAPKLDREQMAAVEEVADEFAYDPWQYLSSRDVGEVADAAIDNLDSKLDWQLYRDSGRLLAVVNLKGRGAADYDDIVAAAAKKLGVPEEAVTSYFTERFYTQLWEEDVQILFHEWKGDFRPLELAVVGRSGGYWGFEIDYSMFDAKGSAKQVAAMIAKGIDLSDYDEDEIDEYAVTDAANDYIEANADDFFKFVRFDDKARKAIGEFDRRMAAEVEWWEKPEKWVDSIEANEYYDPYYVEDEDEDEEE